ncbi:DUF1287 domain-containing protein [Cardiobacterium hominis]|uniref:DUF1287 domain-containing protein n=1 Tax=Cardiobacterium hominis TaxID=2718 RepID=UPI0028EBA339|nr:DUF1287 domain-containing protein [Cardiobacterium hominis]
MILRSYLTLLFFTLLPHLALAFDRNQLVRDARAQIGVTIGYDGTYRQLDYPLGDVPMQTGICTNVIIRALRQQNIVTWRLPGNLLHIGIVSDRRAEDGAPLIIHNIGRGTQEENILNEYPRITHYRYQP